MRTVTNGSTITLNKMCRLQRKRIGCRIGRHRWIITACNIRLQRNNVHNVTAKSFDELIWKCGPAVFSCEESKSRNVVEEGEEAVANWVYRWVVRIVCMIIFIQKNICVSQTPFSDPLSFLCRGGKDKCPVAIADLVLLHNKAQEGIAKTDRLGFDIFNGIAEVKAQWLKYCKPYEKRLDLLVATLRTESHHSNRRG